MSDKLTRGVFFGGEGKTVLDLATEQKQERALKQEQEERDIQAQKDRTAHAERQSQKALRFGAAYGMPTDKVKVYEYDPVYGYDPGLPGGDTVKYQVATTLERSPRDLVFEQVGDLTDEQRKHLVEKGFVIIPPNSNSLEQRTVGTLQDVARERYDEHLVFAPVKTPSKMWGPSPLPNPRELTAWTNTLKELRGSQLKWHTEGCKYDMNGSCSCPAANGTQKLMTIRGIDTELVLYADGKFLKPEVFGLTLGDDLWLNIKEDIPLRVGANYLEVAFSTPRSRCQDWDKITHCFPSDLCKGDQIGLSKLLGNHFGVLVPALAGKFPSKSTMMTLREKNPPLSDDPNDIKARDEALYAHLRRGGTMDSTVLRTDYYGTVKVADIPKEMSLQARAREDRKKRLAEHRETFNVRLRKRLEGTARVRQDDRNCAFSVYLNAPGAPWSEDILPNLMFRYPPETGEERFYGDLLRRLEDHVVPFVKAIAQVGKTKG